MKKREANEEAAKELMGLIDAKKEIERQRCEIHQAWIYEPDDSEAVKLFKQFKELGKQLRKAEDAIQDFIDSF